MAYVIVQTGGKQYRAEEGSVLDIERLDAKAGDSIKLDKVLLSSNEGSVVVGTPYIEGAYADCEVLETFRGRKVISFKYIRREGNSSTKIGHRQWKTKVKVKSLVTG